MKTTAAEANRLLYAQLASSYDETEHCISCERERERLRDLIAAALARLPSGPAALDACGGSGNAAEILVDQGIEPVVVDISSEMLARWRSKASKRGIYAEVHLGEIDDFLEKDRRTWDLIVFSSALHHLEDFNGVLRLASDRLAPNGLIVTSFDPVKNSAAVGAIMRFDWILWELINHPQHAIRLVFQRLSRRSELPTIAQLAERHDATGIDDLGLVRDLELAGIEVIRHDRLADARLGPVRRLLRIIRASSSFSLLLRKRGESGR